MCLKTLYWLQFEYLFKICFFFRFSRHFSIILTTFFNKIRKNIWHISELHKHLKIFVDRHHWSLTLYFIALGHGRWVSRLKWCRKKNTAKDDQEARVEVSCASIIIESWPYSVWNMLQNIDTSNYKLRRIYRSFSISAYFINFWPKPATADHFR